MSKRVLIVEDEIFVALEIEDIVRAAGFEVSAIAADRAMAMDFASNCDIALVDLNLRDGPTGPDIGRELAVCHGVRVVYVTANPSQIGAAQAAALGVVTKPFRPTAIKEALRLAAAEEPDFSSVNDNGFRPFMQSRDSSSGAGFAG